MHMADALVSPVVGGVMMAASVGVAAVSIRSMKNNIEDSKIPLMGVAGAFVFAAQMINFAIPGTGSSGHICGALLLAALLGAGPAFITMGAVLLVQALFFADGGLVAFGCNWFNMGFYACFLTYPLIYKKICKGAYNKPRIIGASILASVFGLQLGAFSVVLQTLASGITELPFGTFVLFMQPIHLAIGIGEGLITGVVLSFIHSARPELLEGSGVSESAGPKASFSAKKVLVIFAACALVVAGVASWFASSSPDGLEWAMENVAGTAELEKTNGVSDFFAGVQESTAIMPDYGFKPDEQAPPAEDESAAVWPAADPGTSVAGIVGSAIVLALAALIGFIVVKLRKPIAGGESKA